MNYLTVAETIFYWLAQYQISQRQIKAQREGKEIIFILEHPIEGKVKVIQPLPEEKYFRSRGIGLKVIQKDVKEVILEVYDHGGIFDPIDYLIPGDHYATTHFALLGAILYQEKKKPEILDKVKRAIEFHLRTSQDEYHFGTWGYHWDFQNYAFLETYRLLKDVVSQRERQQWSDGLRSWRENTKNSLTNWIAMRAYSALLRYRLLGSPADKIRFFWRLQALERARHSDGCYDDYLNQSRPIQYHVFTLALLHRIFLLSRDEKVKKNFLAGVNYFVKFIDPDGCFNYLGRGQEQIFGYAVGLYVLEAAKALDEANAPLYQYPADRMWSYLLCFQRDGHFPLVLNDRKDEEKFGWYDYHHLTVYNAFLGAWLGLTHLLKVRSVSIDNRQSDTSRVYFEFFEPTKNIIISKENYFLVLSGGTPEYLSEPGVTPLHIWFKDVGWIFSCPGGPSPNMYGKINVVEHVEKNFLAPLVRTDDSVWILSAHKQSRIVEATPNSVCLITDYGPFVLNRRISLEEEAIIFEDRFEFKQDGTFQEVRYFNFPVVVDKFQIEASGSGKARLIASQGMVELKVLNTDFAPKDFEKLEKIRTAKGLAQVISLRESPFRTRKGQQNYIQFSLCQLNFQNIK